MGERTGRDQRNEKKLGKGREAIERRVKKEKEECRNEMGREEG